MCVRDFRSILYEKTRILLKICTNKAFQTHLGRVFRYAMYKSTSSTSRHLEAHVGTLIARLTVLSSRYLSKIRQKQHFLPPAAPEKSKFQVYGGHKRPRWLQHDLGWRVNGYYRSMSAWRQPFERLRTLPVCFWDAPTKRPERYLRAHALSISVLYKFLTNDGSMERYTIIDEF